MTVNVRTQRIEVNPPDLRVVVTQAGPVGPSGLIPSGGVDGQVIGKLGSGTTWLSIGTSEEIDTKIAEHEQSTPVHTNATSGRDFSAFFLNGLI